MSGDAILASVQALATNTAPLTLLIISAKSNLCTLMYIHYVWKCIHMALHVHTVYVCICMHRQVHICILAHEQIHNKQLL